MCGKKCRQLGPVSSCTLRSRAGARDGPEIERLNYLTTVRRRLFRMFDIGSLIVVAGSSPPE